MQHDTVLIVVVTYCITVTSSRIEINSLLFTSIHPHLDILAQSPVYCNGVTLSTCQDLSGPTITSPLVSFLGCPPGVNGHMTDCGNITSTNFENKSV